MKEEGLTNRGRPKKKVSQLNSQPKLLNSRGIILYVPVYVLD